MKTYSPKKVLISFNGVPLSGFADGTFIEVDRASDTFKTEVGSDGEGARTALADKSGTITVTLMQTSASNDVLSNALLTDELTNLGTGACFIKDASGRTLCAAAEAWVMKPAKAGFAKESGSREWVIATTDLTMFSGGN